MDALDRKVFKGAEVFKDARDVKAAGVFQDHLDQLRDQFLLGLRQLQQDQV